MADSIQASVTGIQELLRALEGVAKSITHEVLGEAGEAALAPTLADAKTRVPVDTGNLQRGLRIARINRRSVPGGARILMPPRAELGIPADAKGYYPAALEYGTWTGRSEINYLRGSLYQNADQSLRIFRDELAARIDDAVKKNAEKEDKAAKAAAKRVAKAKGGG